MIKCKKTIIKNKPSMPYKKEIEKAETLEELTDVLNRYTDIFEDGRIHKVIGGWP